MFFTAKIGTGSQIQVSETEVKKIVTDALTKGPGAMVMTTSDGKTMTMPASIPAVVQVPAKVSTTVDVVQVPTKVSTTTTTTDEKTVFNNVDSQIGTQIADGGPQQIASQTITSTGEVVQKPVVVPAVPVVPAIPTKPMTMTMNGMTMTMPAMTMFKPTMTMTKPGMMNIGGPGGITMMRPGIPFRPFMPFHDSGFPGTMTMNGKFWVLLYPFFCNFKGQIIYKSILRLGTLS